MVKIKKKKPSYADKLRNRSDRALRKNKGSDEIELLFKLGKNHMDDGDLAKATEIFAQVLRQKPDHLLTIEHMAIASQELKRHDAAETFFKALLEVSPDYARAYGYLGKFYLMRKNDQKAQDYLEKGLAKDPNDPEILNALGNLYHKRGDSETACSYFERAYDQEQGVGNLINWFKAAPKLKSKDERLFRELKKYEKESSVPAYNRAHMQNTLGKAYDQLGDHDQAFVHFDRAAKIVRSKLNFNIKAHAIFQKSLMNYFSDNYFQDMPEAGSDSQEPVFIVGMPRSGSTLLEQILDSHPDITGIGEDPKIPYLVRDQLTMPRHHGVDFPFKRDEQQKNSLDIEGFAKEYLDHLHHVSAQNNKDKTKHYVDKELSNFKWIGIILTAFPNAKILHARRHPMDCALSCFQQNFKDNAQEYSYDLGELGLYYRLYEDMMAHWHSVLPGRILDVQYEDVVNDTEAESRRVLDYIGLPYDPACLEFYKNERFVFTSSAGQINKPVYKTAMAKWKRYEKHLGKLAFGMGDYAPADALHLLEDKA